jgi:hypothetical protein
MRDALIEALGEAFQPGPPLKVSEIADRVLELMAKQHRYRHYKGNEYVLEGEALHTETLERLKIYRTFGTGNRFARPSWMWDEEVVPGTPRFRRLQ